MYQVDEAQPVLLITSIYPMREAVETALRKANFTVRHVPFATAEQVRECGCIVICTPEKDWRSYVDATTGGDDVTPPVILLTTVADPAMWASAIEAGVFDVVLTTARQTELAAVVEKAWARWLRMRLVREALRQNPLKSRVG